jgi:hypothetical protein
MHVKSPEKPILLYTYGYCSVKEWGAEADPALPASSKVAVPEIEIGDGPITTGPRHMCTRLAIVLAAEHLPYTGIQGTRMDYKHQGQAGHGRPRAVRFSGLQGNAQCGLVDVYMYYIWRTGRMFLRPRGPRTVSQEVSTTTVGQLLK